MKKRLFLALSLPDNYLEQFQQYQSGLVKNDELRKRGIRLTPKENLHITVLFLGYLEEEEIGLIFGAVKKVCRMITPFSLEFSETQMNRLVWAVFEKNEIYEKLKNLLEEELAGIIGENFREKNRKTIIHATLARFKKEGGKITLPQTRMADGKFRCDKILLFESQLRSSGPVYSVIGEFKFNEK